MDIDLRQYWLPLAADIHRSLRGFTQKNPAVQVCTVGIFGDGFHGTASLHLDTPAHSSAFVTQWGSSAAGTDDVGMFCANCWDFEYCVGQFEFPNYPDLYKHNPKEPLAFVSLEGTRGLVDPTEGDEGQHCYVFPFLRRLLGSFEPYTDLRRTLPFRVGVQMRESEFIEFWRMDG